MNGNERILAALQRKQPDTVPVFEWFVDVKVGQTLVGSGDIIDIVERMDLDAVNVRADYSKQKIDDVTFVDEWGSKRQLTGDAIAAHLASPIEDIANHKAYRFPDPDAPHRFRSLEKTLQRLGESKAIVLNLRDGFSEVRDLLGYENALMAPLLEPQAFAELIMRSVEYNLKLAEIARKRYGLKVVATTDDVANASGLLFRPETYFELLAPAFKAVMQGYKSMGYLIIKHCDGDVRPLIDFWIEAGIDCLDPIDPGGRLEMGEIKQQYGSRICLKGNIDCTGNLCSGTPAQVDEEVRDCISKGGKGGGLILSSSNTIHQGVKPENFRAMMDAARKYGRYPL